MRQSVAKTRLMTMSSKVLETGNSVKSTVVKKYREKKKRKLQ